MNVWSWIALWVYQGAVDDVNLSKGKHPHCCAFYANDCCWRKNLSRWLLLFIFLHKLLITLRFTFDVWIGQRWCSIRIIHGKRLPDRSWSSFREAWEVLLVIHVHFFALHIQHPFPSQEIIHLWCSLPYQRLMAWEQNWLQSITPAVKVSFAVDMEIKSNFMEICTYLMSLMNNKLQQHLSKLLNLSL